MIDKRVLCPSYYSPIQRKCCSQKNSEVFETNLNGNVLLTYINLTDNRKLIRENFNSNYNCKCLTTSEYEVVDSKYIFQYEINDTRTDKAFSNLIDENDSLFHSFIQ